MATMFELAHMVLRIKCCWELNVVIGAVELDDVVENSEKRETRATFPINSPFCVTKPQYELLNIQCVTRVLFISRRTRFDT